MMVLLCTPVIIAKSANFDRFSASDSKGAVAPTTLVKVNLCNCSENGQCLFGEHAEGQTFRSSFRIVACKCKTGYTGVAQVS